MEDGQDDGHAVGAGNRLIITHMTLENFKSYAGVQHIGPFHKRFSSVVGPNGSGKSNVIDAMMFVFGKKAKQLRLNKLSELIHKSEAFMDLPMCKVSVHFVEILDQDQDGDDYKVIEGTELEVSRVAYRDATASDYFINGKKSNQGPVTTLLKAKGIDLDNNRFLILQGEVEQISLMPPKGKNEHETGMLEYLEEIIGSNRLVEKIEAAGKEVDKLNEERGQKVTKLKIVEKDKDNLEGAKAEAEEYIMLNRKLMQSKGTLYQLYQQEASEQVTVLKEKKDGLDAKLAAEHERLAEVNKTVDDMSAAYKTEKEEYEQAQAELQRTADDFAVFERKDIKYKEDMKHLKAKEKKLHETAKKEAEKASKAKDAIPKQEKAIKEAESTVAKMEKTIPQEQQVLDALYEATKDETNLIREKLDAAQKELLPWSQQTSEAQSAVDIAKSELKLLSNKSVKAKEALAAAQKKLQDAEPTRKAKQAEVASKQKAASKVEKQLTEGKEELSDLRDKESTLRSDINAARSKIEESKAASKASTSQNSVLKALMDANKSGKIPGIHGRLGDLGSIADKYDVAISTACGALNNIVVENTAVAQKCCDFLRKTGAGVATFLLLDKQQHLAAKMNQASSFPVPRLFDLVQPKHEKYLPAFYFALRDTLVADDLDTATKIAFSKERRFRVVTLGGAVIDTSGTMSGGGGKVSKGGMSSAAKKDEGALSEKELAALEKTCAKQCDELTATRSRIQALETSIAQWEREAELLKTAVSRLELELTALAKEQEELMANMSVFETEAKSNPEEVKKIKELEGAVKLNEDALAKAKAKSDAIEKKAKALQQEIMDAGGPKLKMQKTKVDGMQKALDEAVESIAKNKVAIKASHKAIEKAEAAAATAEKEIVHTREAIESTKAEFVGVESAALEVMEAYKRTQEVQAEKQASLKEIEQKYDAARRDAGKLRAAQVDLENEVQDVGKALKENEGKVQAWQAKWDGLKKEYDKDEDVVALDREEENCENSAGNEGEGREEESEGLKENTAEKTRGLLLLSEDALSKHTIKNVKYDITLIEEGLGRISPNMSAIAEYRKKEAEWRERQKELDSATESRDAKRAEHDGLRKQRLDEFMSGFSTITMRLKEMYQMITLGGDAELELVDSLDPFSEGIVFSVRPPKKSWKNISNLSGGEKTLSSLSLVFALHHYKPTPLYVMDEIDAALDFKNVSIVANYIKDRTKDAQFVIISLRNNMFELADRLVGIYKTHHCTKTVAINPAKLAAHLPPPAASVATA